MKKVSQNDANLSFEFRSDDEIHLITFCGLIMLLLGLFIWWYKDFNAGLGTFMSMWLACLVVVVPILMVHRQDVVKVNVADKTFDATKRKLFRRDEVSTFSVDDIHALGSLEFHGDGGPFYKPVVRLKAGKVFVIGTDATTPGRPHAVARAFASALGIDYTESVLA
jgi:hypothetical protein